ncbi:hypothetical protein BJF95_15585 [Rhizobium oryziradicis]|uniref:Uncharacterized protein n=1 Tax=Rhizobium oryziradicis TaxID=1867956 RepID=A0A1Q8ZXD0_9HYPH|nr:hypothetical protein BJF95_15585 [Rhizobium oryziradicis]
MSSPVLRMHSDEQIIFTSSNTPLRCGGHLGLRDEMKICVGDNWCHVQNAMISKQVSRRCATRSFRGLRAFAERV